jgi:hypothetical protein
MAPSQWLLLAVVLVGCAPWMCSGEGGVLAERAQRMTTELPANGALAMEHPVQTWLHRCGCSSCGTEMSRTRCMPCILLLRPAPVKFRP